MNSKAAALGILLVGLATCDSPTRPFSDPRGLLLVVHDNGPAAEIYAMRPDGSDRRQLTKNALEDADPDWSPDGRLIAFVRAQDSTPLAPTRRPDIFVMNADGSHARRLYTAPQWASHPRWSPDGQRIAFDSFDPAAGQSRVYVMNSDGSGVHVLAPDTGDNFSPEWSPDGSRLLFLSNRSPRFWWTMHVMQADGSGEQQLAGDEACATNVGAARWSPDGARIIYSCDEGYNGLIYTISADGADRKQIETAAAFAVWSPAGDKIAFSADPNMDYKYEIYVRGMPNGVRSQITNDDGKNFVADWGPSGR